jgi:cytochrome c2
MIRRENQYARIFGGRARLFLGVATALGLGLTGCRRTPSLTPGETEGKHLYSVRCAHCHDDNDLALKKVPPDLHDVFRRTTLPSGVLATDAEVKLVISSGKGMMPSFAGRFSDDQMNDLIAYLHTGLR